MKTECPRKKIERTCLGCRARKSPQELARLALEPGGGENRWSVVWDEKRRKPGRGAWLCRGRNECLKAALKRRAFEKAFRRGPLDFSLIIDINEGSDRDG